MEKRRTARDEKVEEISKKKDGEAAAFDGVDGVGVGRTSLRRTRIFGQARTGTADMFYAWPVSCAPVRRTSTYHARTPTYRIEFQPECSRPGSDHQYLVLRPFR